MKIKISLRFSELKIALYLYLSTEQMTSRRRLGVCSGSPPCTAHKKNISDKRKWLAVTRKLKTLETLQLCVGNLEKKNRKTRC